MDKAILDESMLWGNRGTGFFNPWVNPMSKSSKLKKRGGIEKIKKVNTAMYK